MFLFTDFSLKLKNFRILIPKKDLLIIIFFWSLLGITSILFPSLLRNLDLKIKDFKIEIRSNYLKDSFKSDILLVGVDSETLDEIPHKWPWAQSYWAEILKDIKEKGLPKALILDFYFQENKSEPPFLNFIKALEMQQNTGLVAIYEESETAYGKQIRVFPPIRELEEVAAFSGISQQPIDEDGKVRSFILHDNRINYRHVAIEILDNCKIPMPAAIKFKNEQTPVAMLDFPVTKRGLNRLSIKELLEDERNYEFLKDRIVVIGATASILHDFHQTPLGLISGPEIICNAIETSASKTMQLINDSYCKRFFYYIVGILLVLILYSDLFKLNSKQTFIVWILLPIFLLIFSFFTKEHPPIELTWLAFTFTAALFIFFMRFTHLATVREQITEAHICSEFQSSLFPAAPLEDESGITCHGLCIPYQNAGGDYYDFIKLKDGNIFFILCDVSGHGVSASMIAAIIKSLIVLETKTDEFNLQKLFEKTNFIVFNLTKRKRMVTAVAGIINPSTKKIFISSAGHIPTIHKHSKGYEELPLPNYPLGISSSKKSISKNRVITLTNNDKLFLYSDGIVEARNWNDEEFGFDALYNVINNIPQKATGAECCQIILKKLREFTNGRDFVDDVSLLVVNCNDIDIKKEKKENV